jgi:hypothetical protein
MREITTKVYTFDELNDKAKEKARDWYREGAGFEAWWEFVYSDAENVGLKITGFDIDRGSYVKAHFLGSAEETAHAIEKEHGEGCDTYATAEAYLKERDGYLENVEKDENGNFMNEYTVDKDLDVMDEEFLKTLQEDYLVHLRKEYEWLMSDEQVDESITANEYEFTEDGKRA